MASSRRNLVARTSSAGNPITQAVTVAAGDTVVVLLLNVVGSANRAGGAPTLGGYTMTQANSTQKAATSPEASAEIWYVLNPTVGAYTLTIPNTSAQTIKYTVEAGQAAGQSVYETANGGNGTSTNPTPGAITVSAGSVAWAIAAGGWQSWAPSARGGTQIADTDDGATGGGEQYRLNTTAGSVTLNWTFGTSDDWGAVVVAFGEIPPPRFQGLASIRTGDGVTSGVVRRPR